MSAPLPAWAGNEVGRSVILKIIAEQPDTRVDWGGGRWNSLDRTEEYRGRNAADLRRLYSSAAEEVCDRSKALWLAGLDHAPVDAELTALFESEGPDALIARVLGEALALTEIHHLGEGRIAA